jgi:hypothetical protein
MVILNYHIQFPVEELKGRVHCKWHASFITPMIVLSSVGKYNQL